MSEIQVCTRCIMDNRSDDTIIFDENGHCNYCTKALHDLPSLYFPNAEGSKKLQALIDRLKKENVNNKYDCLMGISGGLDSSYLAYLGAVKWGLRILAVHIDDGFDEPVAVSNIKNLCEACNIELKVIAPDAEQFYDLTRAYMLAGVPNLAVPQDNVLFAYLYEQVKKYNIRTFLSGGNFALESILQRGNTHPAYDVVNIKSIYKKHGRKSLNKLKFISEFEKMFNQRFYKIETVLPLNYVNYNRAAAIKELHDYCGFEYYGSKHLENTLTKFIQLYWFYHKFHVDKRTSHLSSMIISGQMTRDEALSEMKKPLYDAEKMEKDIDMILEKLELTREEFNQIMSQPPGKHTDYATSKFKENYTALTRTLRKLNVLKR